MRVIAHISDLHFGAILPAVVDGLLGDLYALKPDLVIVSGDLTQRAKTTQFQAAQQFLAQLPYPKIIVPGNHDIPLYNVYYRFFRPLVRYRRYITEDLNPFFCDQEIAVVGINTARSLTFTEGRISAAQLRWVQHCFSLVPQSTIRILVTHHSFLPPRRYYHHVVGGASNLLHQLDMLNPDLLLSGHFHCAYTDEIRTRYKTAPQNGLVIQAGTATSNRTRYGEPNGYNTLKLWGTQVELIVKTWQGQRFAPQRLENYDIKRTANV